jgi:hypothetical protein
MFKIILARFFIWLHLVRRPEYLSRFVMEHPNPDEIVNGIMLIVKDGQSEKWAFFRCPCGCGQRIQLSLSQLKRQKWIVMVDLMSRPTVNPSVRQLSGCKSHFWINRGNIEWCKDSGK